MPDECFKWWYWGRRRGGRCCEGVPVVFVDIEGAACARDEYWAAADVTEARAEALAAAIVVDGQSSPMMQVEVTVTQVVLCSPVEVAAALLTSESLLSLTVKMAYSPSPFSRTISVSWKIRGQAIFTDQSS